MDTPTGMQAIISALSTGLSANTLLAVVADLVPFIIVIVPVALGVYFLRKLVKGTGKAKIRFQLNGLAHLETERAQGLYDRIIY